MDFGIHIKELLLLHDCVILPELGGFVANYKPAEFDQVRNTASPPSKNILFNRNLVRNDGLLYAHVSGVTGYGYKDVENMARIYVDGIRKNIQKGMKFVIDGLGYFYLDSDRQIQFTEETGNNFLLESYGLPFLQYRKFEEIPKTETYRALTAEADPLARQRRIRRWIYGTAAACLLTAVVLIPIKTGYFNQAGIDIPVSDSFKKEQSAVLEKSAESKSEGLYSHPDPETNITESLEGTANLNLLPAPEYHIVVGSFKNFGNARLLRNQLVQEGYNARILSSGKGYFRVSAGTYFVHDQAAENLTTVRGDFENAWILSN